MAVRGDRRGFVKGKSGPGPGRGHGKTKKPTKQDLKDFALTIHQVLMRMSHTDTPVEGWLAWAEKNPQLFNAILVKAGPEMLIKTTPSADAVGLDTNDNRVIVQVATGGPPMPTDILEGQEIKMQPELSSSSGTIMLSDTLEHEGHGPNWQDDFS